MRQWHPMLLLAIFGAGACAGQLPALAVWEQRRLRWTRYCTTNCTRSCLRARTDGSMLGTTGDSMGFRWIGPAMSCSRHCRFQRPRSCPGSDPTRPLT
jgi:hypothetical protein